jgi:hypothetical protein
MPSVQGHPAGAIAPPIVDGLLQSGRFFFQYGRGDTPLERLCHLHCPTFIALPPADERRMASLAPVTHGRAQALTP